MFSRKALARAAVEQNMVTCSKEKNKINHLHGYHLLKEGLGKKFSPINSCLSLIFPLGLGTHPGITLLRCFNRTEHNSINCRLHKSPAKTINTDPQHI